MLEYKDHNNFTTWQIDIWEKLISEMDRDFDKILLIILDMQKIYTEYLDQANKADN